MAFLPIFMLLLLAISSSMPAYSNAAYCVCNSGVSDPVLQKNIDYACGAGADCGQISPNGPCFNPNTVKDHCNFAVNSYYQKKGQVDGSCVFSGTATVVQTPPSGVNSACLSGNPSTSTPAPPGTGTGTPPSGTGTPGTGTPPSGTGTPGTGTPPSGTGTPGTGTPPSGTGTPGTGTPPSGTGTPGTGTPPSGTGTPGTGTPPSGTGTPGMGTPGTGTGTGTGIGTGGGTGINVNPPIGMGPAGTSGYGGDSSGCGCIHHDQMITTILSLPTLLVSGLIWFLQM